MGQNYADALPSTQMQGHAPGVNQSWTELHHANFKWRRSHPGGSRHRERPGSDIRQEADFFETC